MTKQDKDIQNPHDEEQLLPLRMPDEEDKTPDSAPETEGEDSGEEEELDNKAAHRKLIESFTDDEGEKVDFNLRFVLSGNILTTTWLRKQILWLVMIVVLTVLYISNGYYAQNQRLHIKQLEEDLKEVHYDAMARSAELMRHSRRSIITEQLNANPENALKNPQKQPVLVDEE